MVNQINIAGPNIEPTFFVPNLWKKNNAEIITITIGTVGMCSNPFIFLSPSTADATEIGGVIIPSANSADAPSIVGIIKYLPYPRTNAYKEKIPPSP